MKRFIWEALVVSVPSLFFLSCSGEGSGNRMPVTTDSDLALEYYQTGMTAFDRVKIDLANTNLEMAVKEDPDFFMAYFWLYFLSSESHKLVAENALKTNAPLSKAEQEIKTAFDYLIDGEDEMVVQHLNKAIELYPDDPHVYKILYILQFQFLKDTEGAIQTMQRAIDAAPEYPLVYNQLGYALMKQGEYKMAEEAFDKYMELASGIANPYDSKGDFYMVTGQYEKAYQNYTKAFAVDSGFSISEKKARKARQLMESSPVN